MQEKYETEVNSSYVFDSATILLIFTIIVINQLFLISLIVILIKKIKLIVKSTPKKYHYFATFYIVSKLLLCILLQIKIIIGFPTQFQSIKSQTVQKVFDNSIIFADCSIVQLFLIAFEHYIVIYFSVFGNQKVQYTIGLLMRGIQLVIFLTLMIPLLLFNVCVIPHQMLKIFIMSFNCLSVIAFIAALFFINCKNKGPSIDQRFNEIVKKVYALLLTLLLSRFAVSILEVWMHINITQEKFEDVLPITTNNLERYAILGLCFILYLIIVLVSEGLPLLMSLRSAITTAITEIRDSSNSSQSSQRMSNQLTLNLMENMELIKDEHLPNVQKCKNPTKKKSDSFSDIMKIKNSSELQLMEKIQNVNQDFAVYRAKWTKNEKNYFVRQFGRISKYIRQDLLSEMQTHILMGSTTINPINIIEKSKGNKILIVEKYLIQNLSAKMSIMRENDSSIQQKIGLAIKIVKAIKEFHDRYKVGHGVLNPKNILLDDLQNVYLTGFGMESLKKYLSLTTQYTNISMYTAVELLGTSRQKIVIKPQQTADIYSFGIILYEMVSNNFEYRNESIMEIRKKFGEENARPKIPQEMNQHLKTILRKCWAIQPSNRPQIAQLIICLQNLQQFL